MGVPPGRRDGCSVLVAPLWSLALIAIFAPNRGADVSAGRFELTGPSSA